LHLYQIFFIKQNKTKRKKNPEREIHITQIMTNVECVVDPIDPGMSHCKIIREPVCKRQEQTIPVIAITPPEQLPLMEIVRGIGPFDKE
jgi:hypothetical protein